MENRVSASLTEKLREIADDLDRYRRDEDGVRRRNYEALDLVATHKLERRTESGNLLIVRPVSTRTGNGEIDELKVLKEFAEEYHALVSIDILLIERSLDLSKILIFCGINWGPSEYPTLLWREVSLESAVDLITHLFSPETLKNDAVEELMAGLVYRTVELRASTQAESPKGMVSPGTPSHDSRGRVESPSSTSEDDESTADDVPYAARVRYYVFCAVRDSYPLDAAGLRDVVKSRLGRNLTDKLKGEIRVATNWNIRWKKLCRDANRQLDLNMDRGEAMSMTMADFVNNRPERKETAARHDNDGTKPHGTVNRQSEIEHQRIASDSVDATAYGSKSATGSSRRGKLLGLLEAGLVHVGSKLVMLDDRWPGEGTVLSDGWIDVGGQAHSSPSAAAQAVSGRKAESGWTVWAVGSRDGLTLDQLRDRLPPG